jgi:hypothetical protein
MAEKMRVVARRVILDPKFGLWLKHSRERAGIRNPKDVAAQAKVSLDSIRRMERGEVVGSAHLTAWLAWLNHYKDSDFRKIFDEWPDRLLGLGSRAADLGLASKPPKSGSKSLGERQRADTKRRHAGAKSA